MGIKFFFYRLNIFLLLPFTQLTRASTLHVVDLPFKEHHIFIIFSRTQYMSSAQQDLVPRHPLGKFSLHTRRHMIRRCVMSDGDADIMG